MELVLSRGHAPVEIPRLAGVSESEATESLQAAGFTVTTDEDFSNRVDRGSVIGISPKAGVRGSVRLHRHARRSHSGRSDSGPQLHRAHPLARPRRGPRTPASQTSFTDLPGGTGVVITQSPAPGVTVTYDDTIQLFLL